MRQLYFLIIFSVFSCSIGAQVAPTATIVRTSGIACTGAPVTYTVASSGSLQSYTWSVQPTKDLISSSDPNASGISFSFSSTAHHTIYLTYSDNSGAIGNAVSALRLNQAPNASFNASFNAPGFPTNLILTNYSSNFNTNFWSFSDSPGDSALNTTKSYTASGNYTVTLLTFGDKGCKDSSSYDFVLANTSNVTLPNIFTPNGDGVNDVFKPITQQLSSLQAFVFNRYGVLVTSWNTVNGFWDGYTASGEECSDGVYIVVLEAKGFDGKDYKLNSTINLVR
jgi:gliding motility-associated-like protein